MSDDDKILNGLDGALSELMQCATQMHELFMSFVTAGFERPEALYLVAQMARGGGGHDV